MKNGPVPFAHIPEAEIKAYAKIHKLTPLDAYRDLFSQKLLDKLEEGDVTTVVKELIYQIAGTGSKGVIAEAKTLPH